MRPRCTRPPRMKDCNFLVTPRMKDGNRLVTRMKDGDRLVTAEAKSELRVRRERLVRRRRVPLVRRRRVPLVRRKRRARGRDCNALLTSGTRSGAAAGILVGMRKAGGSSLL